MDGEQNDGVTGGSEALGKEGYDEKIKEEEAQKDGQDNGPSSPSSSENMRREHGWCLIFRDGTESEGREGGDLSLAVEGQKMSNRAMRNLDVLVDRSIALCSSSYFHSLLLSTTAFSPSPLLLLFLLYCAQILLFSYKFTDNL